MAAFVDILSTFRRFAGARLATGLALLLSLAHAASPSLAQLPDAFGPSITMDDRLDVRIDVGVGNHVTLGRWNALRITLLGGSDAIAGDIVVEQRGPSTGPMRLVAPFVTTPRQATPIDLAIPLDWVYEPLVVSLFDDRGRRIRREEVELDELHTRSITNPWMRSGRARLTVAQVGRSSLATALGIASQEPIDEEAVQSGTRHGAVEPYDFLSIQPVSVRPDELPTAWPAYDALDALMLHESELARVSDEARRAILRWVREGGALVLSLDRATSAYEAWLPEHGPRAAPPVQLDGFEGFVRELSVSADAQRLGWRVRSFEPDEDAPTHPLQRAWIAEGPLGLGWCIVLGADPNLVRGELTAPDAWRDALRDLIAQPPRNESRASMSAVIDELAHMLDHGTSVPFAFVLLFLAALGLLLGPIDWLVLRKLRLMHRSWLVACGWIGLFALVAWITPNLLLSGESLQRRITFDTVTPGEGFAHRAGATAVFAGSAGIGVIEGVERGALWTPVTAMRHGPRVEGTWTGFQGPAFDGGAAPGPLQLRLWTMRPMSDRNLVAPIAHAEIRRAGAADDEACEILIHGLSGLEITDAVVVFAEDDARSLTPTRRGDGVWRCVSTASQRRDTDSIFRERFAMPQSTSQPMYPQWGRRWTGPDGPWAARHLTSHNARSHWLRLRLQRSDAAMLMIAFTDGPSDIGVRGVDNRRRMGLIQLLLPVVDVDAIDLEEDHQ